MTILAGIICSEAVILAADSQFTDPSTGTYFYKNKISEVEFKFEEILIAQAGLPSITDRAMEIMREKAQGVEITSPRIVNQIAEDAVREAKHNLDDEQKKCCKNCGAEMMLAFYVNGKPHLFTLDVFGSGVATAANRHFAVTGTGAFLADYLLSQFTEPKMTGNAAIGPLVYVIHQVKKHQKAYCGGDTVIKWLWPLPSYISPDQRYIGCANTADQKAVNLSESPIDDLDKKIKNDQRTQMTAIFNQVGQTVWAEHVEKVKAKQRAKLTAS